jgi:hypothetical protein
MFKIWCKYFNKFVFIIQDHIWNYTILIKKQYSYFFAPPLLYTFIYFLVVLGLELRAYTMIHSTSPFVTVFFQNRVFWTICPGWLQTAILLISASWVAWVIEWGTRAQHSSLTFLFSISSSLLSSLPSFLPCFLSSLKILSNFSALI